MGEGTTGETLLSTATYACVFLQDQLCASRPNVLRDYHILIHMKRTPVLALGFVATPSVPCT
jgi:hypothetical protein